MKFQFLSDPGNNLAYVVFLSTRYEHGFRQTYYWPRDKDPHHEYCISKMTIDDVMKPFELYPVQRAFDLFP